MLYSVSDPSVSASIPTDDHLQTTALTRKEFGAETYSISNDGYAVYSDDAAGTHQTLTRLSTEIISALPYPPSLYALYQTSTEIHAIELDDRGDRNDVTLATGTGMAGMAVDRK